MNLLVPSCVARLFRHDSLLLGWEEDQSIWLVAAPIHA